MTATAPLRIAIGARAQRREGETVFDAGPGADPGFGYGDALPFPDRAVQSIHVDRDAIPVTFPETLRLLIECRRVLAVRGSLGIGEDAAGRPMEPDSLSRVVEAARIVGLTRTQSEGAAVPVSRVPWPPDGTPRTDTFESSSLVFTKSQRQCTADPAVSICIPAFNPAFFEASLNSALGQTYRNVEIVVCDDSRADEITSIVEATCRRKAASNVRYIRNPGTLGTRGNFTRCLESSQGEYVKFLCDDDLLAPECVEALMEGFRSVPDVTLTTSRRQRIDAYSRALPDQPATDPVIAGDAVIAGATLANAMLMIGLNRVGEPSTALFRKDDLLDQAPTYFGFCGNEGHGFIDLATWAALLLKGDVVYRSAYLSSFRIHPGQRQHDPAKGARNIATLRSMQATWLALGLADTLAPDKLAVKPFPPGSDDPWRLQTILGLSARRIGPPPGPADLYAVRATSWARTAPNT